MLRHLKNLFYFWPILCGTHPLLSLNFDLNEWFSIDKGQTEELIPLIEKLLCDNSLNVLNSAILTYNEVCPNRFDLLHHNYRNLCNNLLNLDSLSQIVLLHILTRYGRDQFLEHFQTVNLIILIIKYLYNYMCELLSIKGK